MRKVLFCILGLLILSALAFGCGSSSHRDKKPAAQKFVTIATGGASGTYFPLGGALADILNKTLPGTNASTQSTEGSIANIALLQQGRVNVAFVQNDIAYYAANGTEMFKGKQVTNLQALATLYPETVQIVALKKSGIKSVADFKGKRIAVGAKGSGTEVNARQIMEAYGLTYNDADVKYLPFAEAANALKIGLADVAVITAGHPTAAILDLAKAEELVVVPVDGDKAEALVKKYPFYTKTSIAKGTYDKQAEDVPAVAVKCMLIATDKMDSNTAYSITKALFGNLDRMIAAHAAAKLISKAEAKNGLSITMNAGATRYFAE